MYHLSGGSRVDRCARVASQSSRLTAHGSRFPHLGTRIHHLDLVSRYASLGLMAKCREDVKRMSRSHNKTLGVSIASSSAHVARCFNALKSFGLMIYLFLVYLGLAHTIRTNAISMNSTCNFDVLHKCTKSPKRSLACNGYRFITKLSIIKTNGLVCIIAFHIPTSSTPSVIQ